jgi:dGTP triphosphohydrolase
MIIEGPFNEYACIRGEQEFIPPSGEFKFAPRTWYQRDIDQIVYSTVFRKLQGKTQLLSNLDPRKRTRMVHTIEVARIAREISEKLGINCTLTEAIAFGHDLANSPIGARGNGLLKRLSASSPRSNNGFTHEIGGIQMLQTIASRKVSAESKECEEIKEIFARKSKKKLIKWESKGTPIEIYVDKDDKDYYEYRICPEVLDGVEQHTTGKAKTLEGQVVWVADQFAYLSQDIGDLQYCNILNQKEIEDSRMAKSLTVGGVTKGWKEINDYDVKKVDLKRALSIHSGERISTLIGRFVNFNNLRIKKGNLGNLQKSPYLEAEMPSLMIDEGLSHFMNYMWSNLIENHYDDPKIDIPQRLQESLFGEAYYMLSETTILNENQSVVSFLGSLNLERYNKFGNNWKIAYLLTHLSYEEVVSMLRSFQRHNNNFKIDLGESSFYA